MSAPDNNIEWPWEAEEDLPEMPAPAPDASDLVQVAPVLFPPSPQDRESWDDDDSESDEDLDDDLAIPNLPQWDGLDIDPPPTVDSPWPSAPIGAPPLPAWAREPSEGNGGPPWGIDDEAEDDEEEEEDGNDYLEAPPWAAEHLATPATIPAAQDDIQLPDDYPPEKLRELATHPSQYVRVQVAAHPNCPVDLMPQFAQDSSHMVRWALWERPDVPPDVLRHIDLDSLPADEAYMIAASPACSYEQVMAWYHGRPDDYTIAVLSIMHPRAPDQWVQQILDGLSTSVRSQLARSSSNERLQKFLFKDPDMALQLADNPNCALDLLDELAKSADIKIKNLVVQHARAPLTALVLLLQDPDRRIANKAARHPNLPEEYKHLAKLAQ